MTCLGQDMTVTDHIIKIKESSNFDSQDIRQDG